MKKWIALLLTGILTLSLGGCAESARSLGGKITETEVYMNADESAAADESGLSDDKVADQAAKEQEKDTSSAADQSGDVSSEGAGNNKNESADKTEAANKNSAVSAETEKITQKVYLQDHFGYRVVLDEDWEFAGDKEIEQMNQAVAKEAEGDNTFAKIVNAENLYTDMVANDTVTGNSIIVKLVRIGLADVVGSDEERNEILSDALYAEAEAAGLKKIQKTSTEVKFLGEPVTAIGVKGDLKLSDEYTTEMWYQMLVKQKGTYASVIFVTGFTEFAGDNFQEILDKFETIE